MSFAVARKTRRAVILLLTCVGAAGLAACSDSLPPTATLVAPSPTPVVLAVNATPANSAALPADGAPEAAPTVAPQATSTPTATPDPGFPLKGRRIGLDPGHGPRKDMGAVLVNPDTGKLILSEEELNLDVGLRLRDILTAMGADVVLTRDKPDSFTVPWNPDTNQDGKEGTEADDLQHRIDILNDFHAEVFLSIHANSAGNPARRGGVQALYCATSDCPFPEQTRRLGKLTLDHLEAALSNTGVPIKKRELRSDMWSDTPGEFPSHLFMLGPAKMPRHPRAAQMPGIIIEALYVTSPDEAAQLKLDSVRQTIAQAYADALKEYFGSGEQP